MRGKNTRVCSAHMAISSSELYVRLTQSRWNLMIVFMSNKKHRLKCPLQLWCLPFDLQIICVYSQCLNSASPKAPFNNIKIYWQPFESKLKMIYRRRQSETCEYLSPKAYVKLLDILSMNFYFRNEKISVSVESFSIDFTISRRRCHSARRLSVTLHSIITRHRRHQGKGFESSRTKQSGVHHLAFFSSRI